MDGDNSFKMDEEVDLDEGTQEYKPSFVLVAIDTHPSMFIKNEDSESPFELSLKACYGIADSLIFAQSTRTWNQFAVVVANEDEKASLLDFNKNLLESVKILKEEADLSHSDLVQKYQRKGPFDVGSFFLFCKKKYKEIKSQFYKRTIIYITNDDDPVIGDKSKRFTALNEVKNLDAMDIVLEIVTMNPKFNYSTFYNELFSQMQTAVVEQFVEDGDGLLEKLQSSIIFRHFQRKIEFYPFKGDQKRFLKVIQKKTISQFKLYNNAFVTANDKQVNKIIEKEQVGAPTYRLKYGPDGQMSFGIQDYYAILNNDLPKGYTLLHVSKRVTDVGFTLGPPYILEIDPKEDPQFIHYFNNFWKYCVENDKVLICARKLTQSAKIRFVEFIPKFANNKPIFLIKTIPFANEIHYPSTMLTIKEEDEERLVTEEQTNIMIGLIDELTYDYDPKMFPNPSIAKKKAFLKAKFLEEKFDGEFEDVTLSSEGIDARISDLEPIFNKLFVKEKVGQKRKKSEPAKKRYIRKTK